VGPRTSLNTQARRKFLSPLPGMEGLKRNDEILRIVVSVPRFKTGTSQNTKQEY
jgi:hypothetical protein